MHRPTSRMAVPAIAATVLATLLAQPILAAKPTITASHSEGTSSTIASMVQSACGISVQANFALDSRTTVFPAGSPNAGSIYQYRQTFSLAAASTGGSATLRQAGVIRTYQRDGHAYVVFTGRSYLLGWGGTITRRDGAVVGQYGNELGIDASVCRSLGAASPAGPAAGPSRGGVAPAAERPKPSAEDPAVDVSGRGRSAASRSRNVGE